MYQTFKEFEQQDEINAIKLYAKISIIVSILILVFLGLVALANATPADDLVKIAQSQIGKGEIGGDNKGKDVKKYTKGQEVAWCAGFVSWVRSQQEESGNYFLSARSYWKAYSGRRVKDPKPGDIICFYRGSRGGPFGHVGIVEKVSEKTITTIEGNKGAYPAKVKRFKYQLGKIPKLLGFVRVI